MHFNIILLSLRTCSKWSPFLNLSTTLFYEFLLPLISRVFCAQPISFFSVLCKIKNTDKRCRANHANKAAGSINSPEIVPQFIHTLLPSPPPPSPHGRLIRSRRCSETTRKQLTVLQNFFFSYFSDTTHRTSRSRQEQ
jgi:hypothetical protein